MCYLGDQKTVSFSSLLQRRGEEQSDTVGYLFLADGEALTDQMTYGELDKRARAIASLLSEHVSPGDRALLFYPSGLDFIAAFFGCLYAGVIAVPLYFSRSSQYQTRMMAIAQDATASLALTLTALLPDLKSFLPAASPIAPLTWLTTDSIDAARSNDWKPIQFQGDALAFLQYTSGTTGIPKGVKISHQNLLHNSALIQTAFQSTQESMGVSWLPIYHDMGLIGGVLQPLYVGRPMVLMPPAAFVQKPWRWLQAISRYRATTSGGPNFAYDLCVKKIRPDQKESLDLSCWQVAFTGAEPIRAQTLENFTQVFESCQFSSKAFHPCYGMAETTLMVSSKLNGEAPQIVWVDGVALEQHRLRLIESSDSTASTRAVVSCGTFGQDQLIKIVDSVSQTPCADSTIGEIWVSSPSVAQGYWQRIEESKHSFDAYLADGSGPFLRTGDLGFIRQGELFVTGRLKDLIIIRGRNHYPQDIEASVQQCHPALSQGQAVAFAVTTHDIERLVIHQEINRQDVRSLDGDAVISAIRQSISRDHQLQVSAIALLKPGTLPRTSSGKIQRTACREAYEAGEFQPLAQWQENSVDVQEIQQSAAAMLAKLQASRTVEPATPSESLSSTLLVKPQKLSPEEIQHWMVANLALYLNVRPEEVDVTEPFSHYGLDSSVALSLTGELSSWICQELEPTIFWEYPSIESLATYLGQPA